MCQIIQLREYRSKRYTNVWFTENAICPWIEISPLFLALKMTVIFPLRYKVTETEFACGKKAILRRSFINFKYFTNLSEWRMQVKLSPFYSNDNWILVSAYFQLFFSRISSNKKKSDSTNATQNFSLLQIFIIKMLSWNLST